MSDTPNVPTYFPMLVTFFIINEAFYKIQMGWAKFVTPICTLNLQVLPWFYWEITLLKIKCHISVHRHFLSVNYLALESLHTLTTQYATRVQRTSCLQIIFLSGKSIEYLIILDFLWKEMMKILKVGFSDFNSISWSYEIMNCFVFTSLSK